MLEAVCKCGKHYKLKDQAAGKRFRCKACGKIFSAPLPEEEPDEVLETAEEETTEEKESAPPPPPAPPAPVAAPVNPLRSKTMVHNRTSFEDFDVPAANPQAPVAAPQVAAPTYYAVQNPRPEAIVVHCHDPKFQVAFDQFIKDELKLGPGRYVRLVVGGGAGVLANPMKLPKEFKFMKERFEYLRERFPEINRIILINHEGCGYYGTLKERVLNYVPENLKGKLAELPREDLKLLQGIFGNLLSHLRTKLELYYAKYADPEHSKIVFERMV